MGEAKRNKAKKNSGVVEFYAGIIFKVVSLVTVVIFVILNLGALRLVPPLYYSFANEDEKAVVTFLRRSEALPQFKELLTSQKEIYGENLEAEVYQDTKNREQSIAQLEQLLLKNDKSRDVLYKLYLLYAEEGNVGKANEYLTRARDVDPDVGK